MDKHIYQQKMRELINVDNIYEKINENKAIKETQKFTSDINKLLKNEDFSWIKLIEYQPKTPALYGLPKT